jgi:hypothetical protein
MAKTSKTGQVWPALMRRIPSAMESKGDSLETLVTVRELGQDHLTHTATKVFTLNFAMAK